MLRTLLGLSAALVLSTGAVLTFWRLDRISVAPGVVTGGSQLVCAPRDGLIAEVLVRSGDAVRPGQPLVRLDSRDLQVESARRMAVIEALETRRRASAAEQKHLREAVQPQERAEAQREVERARLRLRQAEIAAQATARLGEEGIAGQLQVEQTELDRKLAAVALTDAEQVASTLQARQAAAVNALTAEARRLDEEMEAERVQEEALLRAITESTVHAEAVGVVATGRLDELAGRAVRAGDEVLRLTLTAPGKFEGILSDAARVPVRLNQRVKIRVEGYPWLVYGTVTGRVVRVAGRREGNDGFPVEIELDPGSAPGPLADGMRGTARIIVEEKVPLARMLLERAAGRTGT